MRYARHTRAVYIKNMGAPIGQLAGAFGHVCFNGFRMSELSSMRHT